MKMFSLATMQKVLAAVVAVAALVAAPGVASATDYAVHVHGRTQITWDDTWWTMAGYTNVKCDYNSTTATLASANVTVRSCLATRCSGANRCIIIAYSNGMNQVQYTQQYYPANLANLLYIEAGSSAAGGSELASVGSVAQSFLNWFGVNYEIFYANGVDATLGVTTARAAYNHNINNGKTTYHVVGNTNALNWIWPFTAGTLPGDDDGVVSWASGFGCNASGSQTYNCTKFTGHVTDGGCTSNGWFGTTDHFSMDERGSYCY